MTHAPAVSVIIPMYNAKNFIAECLESLLIQTFSNYEIIVVDDCSTDNSAAIVERYIPKFGGRLKISHMKKNSGRPSLPRNKGLKFSRGKYIFFMDNDDLLTETALAELHALAEEFAADVVYCERYIAAHVDLSNAVIHVKDTDDFVTRPTFETENFSQRLEKILRGEFWVMPWTKFLRRDLLLEHEIFFPDIIRDDDIWTWSLLFRAKKFLRVPNAVYIWRNVEDSITRVEKNPAQEINFWLNPVILGVQNLNAVLERIEFFQKNPRARYTILDYFVEVSFAKFLDISYKMEPFEIYDVVRQKFSAELGGQDVLVPLLCSLINAQQRLVEQARRKIFELEARQ